MWLQLLRQYNRMWPSFLTSLSPELRRLSAQIYRHAVPVCRLRPPRTSRRQRHFTVRTPYAARSRAQQCLGLTRELFCFHRRVPGSSKLVIPATASFQITLGNLASVGSPLYGSLPPCPSLAPSDNSYSPRSFLHFNRAGEASRPSDGALSVWELDGWWQPAAADAPGAVSMRTAFVIVACAVVVLAFFIYRYAQLLLFSA
jgi:hypothetical protein